MRGLSMYFVFIYFEQMYMLLVKLPSMLGLLFPNAFSRAFSLVSIFDTYEWLLNSTFFLRRCPASG